MPAIERDDDNPGAQSGLAEQVAVFVVHHDDQSRPPLVVLENSGDWPIYGLAVFCYHHASLISRTYPLEQPHHGRMALIEFSALLGSFYGGDPKLAREAQLAAGCSFRDAAGRWWSRPAEADLAEARNGNEAWRRAFSAPPGRTGPQMWHSLD